MTAVLDNVGTLAEEELADLIGGEDDTARTAAIAELDRRDRAARKYAAGHGRRRMQDTAWAEAAHAQYLQADERCRGHLLSRKGKAAGVTEWSLWTGPEHVARAHASEELNALWDDQGRVTVSQWRDAMAADRREERDTAAAETASKGTETRDMGLIYAGLRAAQASGQRQRSQGMTQQDMNAVPAVQRIRKQHEARQAQRKAVAALQDMAAERRAHSQVAVPDQSAPATVQGTVVARKERDPIDGALLLDYVRMYLERFAVWPSEAVLDAAVLWIAHTHARDSRGRLVWQYSPHWLWLSSDPGSGKSWLLKIMLKLASQGKLLIEPTPAAVARSIGLQHRTIGLDESDILFGAGGRNAQIRAIVNTSYEPDGEWSRATKGNDTSDIPVFGALAAAALDKMKTATGDTLRAMFERFIIARAVKAPDGYRPPRFDDKARSIALALSNAQAAWCAQELGQLREAIPEVPEGLGNRAAALWEPLLAVADAAGGRWPEAARDACEELIATEGLPGDDLDELGDMLAGWE